MTDSSGAGRNRPIGRSMIASAVPSSTKLIAVFGAIRFGRPKSANASFSRKKYWSS
jgi:hypothetical protein